MKAIRLSIALASLGLLSGVATAAAPEPLRDAARKAVVANPEVQARWHAFRAADAERDVARGGYFPQLDLTASAGRERRDRPNLSADTFNHTNAMLTLNQMVYDGFFTYNEVARLGYAKLARYYELLDAAEVTASEAVRAYSDVLRYRERVALAKANYVEHKRIYDQIADRAGAGVGRRVDLEQAFGRLALAESNLLTETANLHDVSARYQRVTGDVPAEGLPSFGDRSVFAGIPATAKDALREAFNTNPALNAAVENVRASQSEVDVRRAAYHPRVFFRASQAVDHNLDGIDGHSRDTVAGFVMSYNLFRGGSDQARIGQAAEALNQAKDLREKSCRDLRQTLSIAYNDIRQLEEQLRYLDQHQLAVAKAREAYHRQFDIGQRTLLDLLDTENEYFQARLAYVDAAYNQIVAQSRTLSSVGRLMPALNIAREDLPTAADAGQDRTSIDPDTICPPDVTPMLHVDKEALLAEALREGGYRKK